MAGVPKGQEGAMHIIGYDIHDDQRRKQLMRLLRGMTACWQESFFVVSVEPEQREALFRRLRESLDLQTDSLIMAAVHPACAEYALSPACMQAGNGIYWLE